MGNPGPREQHPCMFYFFPFFTGAEEQVTCRGVALENWDIPEMSYMDEGPGTAGFRESKV